jgi:hypothetical protein
LRAELGREGRRHVAETYEWERCVDRMERCYERTMQQARRAEHPSRQHTTPGRLATAWSSVPYYLAREWVRAGHRVQIVAGSYSHVRAQQPEVADEPVAR